MHKFVSVEDWELDVPDKYRQDAPCGKCLCCSLVDTARPVKTVLVQWSACTVDVVRNRLILLPLPITIAVPTIFQFHGTG